MILQMRKGGRKGLGDMAKLPQFASNRVRIESMFLILHYPVSLSLS